MDLRRMVVALLLASWFFASGCTTAVQPKKAPQTPSDWIGQKRPT